MQRCHLRPPGGLARRGAAAARCRGVLPIVCSVRARWTLDVRYGHKAEATALLQEWVKDVGRQAGLTGANTRISSGSIGAPESKLELEVSLGSLGDFEAFLSRIPFKDHKAWSQRVQSMVVDGTPRWEVYRTVPVLAEDGADPAAAAAVAAPAALSLPAPAPTVPKRLPPMMKQQQQRPQEEEEDSFSKSMSAAVAAAMDKDDYVPGQLSIVEGKDSAEVILDWKGDPMVINPGDKLPFKFL